MVGRRRLKLLLGAVADGVIGKEDLDLTSVAACLRLGFVLGAYRERKELEWDRFEYAELATLLRQGLVDKGSAEAVQKHKQRLYRRLQAGYLFLDEKAEEDQYRSYGTMWEQEFGKLTDEDVSRSIDLAVEALAAMRKQAAQAA